MLNVNISYITIYFCEYLYSLNNKTNKKFMLIYIQYATYIFKIEIEILYNEIVTKI